MSCKIWYSISRTVSDDDAHRGGMMIARFAVKPRAYGAPQKRALGLDRSARPSNFGDRAANALTTHVPVNHRTPGIGQRPRGRVLVFSPHSSR
jgi:hypothetical protein